MEHQEDQALLKAYITEWRKFFTQCNYLPTPFRQLENSLAGKAANSKKGHPDKDSVVRKVKLLYIYSMNIVFQIKLPLTFLSYL